ncbi:Hypp3207 [Branchiostoma lanceolatum]|uniref:Hypp3207 protein n=1 Tax=Branchiostoma lanceolatum TaxID=7740 RepID=A0A8J9ZYC3_BRALA|nr:Hypp3207 [Branchiostoma lanceolatum]
MTVPSGLYQVAAGQSEYPVESHVNALPYPSHPHPELFSRHDSRDNPFSTKEHLCDVLLQDCSRKPDVL